MNGELVGENSFTRTSEKGFPRMLGLGTYLQAAKGDSFQGQIDAIAVSPEALEPADFVLPLPKADKPATHRNQASSPHASRK